MLIGRLATAAIATGAIAQFYQVPVCKGAELDLVFVNTTGADIQLQLAVGTAAAPVANDYVEKGVVVPANGGTYRLSNFPASEGERLFGLGSAAGLVARVGGKLHDAVN